MHKLGTHNDLRRRATTERVDDDDRRSKVDLVRKWIYEKGMSVTSVHVRRVLGSEALVPTRVSASTLPNSRNTIDIFFIFQNAFSEKLSALGFDFYKMYLVDLLHEFELGVWRDIFKHLLRILYAHGSNAITELNQR